MNGLVRIAVWIIALVFISDIVQIALHPDRWALLAPSVAFAGMTLILCAEGRAGTRRRTAAADRRTGTRTRARRLAMSDRRQELAEWFDREEAEDGPFAGGFCGATAATAVRECLRKHPEGCEKGCEICAELASLIEEEAP